MPEVLILRHAQSTWNADGRWQGQADPPLTALGQCQARQAARRLSGEQPFDLVVSSDLSRAVETAALMNTELGSTARHEIESSLREYDVGAWSGHTRDEIEAGWPGYLSRFSQGQLDYPPGGESRADFEERVAQAGRWVATRARANRSKRVLVVAHGGVVRSFARLAGRPETRTGHLAGYRGSIATDGLLPTEPVDLLVGEDDSSGLSL
jgi:broad specificity phosphatase PhoE